MALKALITAGGTIEAIDDVRTFQMATVPTEYISEVRSMEIANISKGGFGRTIAEAFCKMGVETTLVGRTDLCKKIKTPPEGLTLVPFRSFSDLHEALHRELFHGDYDIVLMAAAVSDYSPVRVAGKLSSDSDSFTLEFTKNPKLLDQLHDWTGGDATLVGFKLLSRVSKEKLISVAKNQNFRARLDLTVANDMQEIDWDNGIHPIEIVDRLGNSTAITGKRPKVAKALVKQILEFHQAKS